MPPKVESESSSGAVLPKKGKKGGKGKKKTKEDLKAAYAKGWLATPQDWARFNAWACIRAKPKKIPRTEDPARPSKPLGQLKKRLILLAKPRVHPINYNRDRLGISPMTLKAKASKRLKRLAQHVDRQIARGRPFPAPITKEAMEYIATERLIALSQPGPRSPYMTLLAMMELAKSGQAGRKPRETSSRTDRLAEPKMPATGDDTAAKRSPSISSWMNVVILPHYKFLKDRRDTNAKEWKKVLMEAELTRGPRAMRDSRIREQRRRKRAKEREKRLQEARLRAAQAQDVCGKPDEPAKPPSVCGSEDDKEPAADGEEPAGAGEEPAGDGEEPAGDGEEPAGDGEEPAEEAEASSEEAPAEDKPPQKEKPPKKEKEPEDEEAAKKRFDERNAWRFKPNPYRPPVITKAALEGQVPPNVDRMAKAKPAPKSLTREPFKVRKGALSYTITPAVEKMAKPKFEHEGEIKKDRDNKREHDKFGAPIFPKPKFGRKMRKVKYKMAEPPCDEKPEEDENARKTFEEIDPTVFAPTIDPCFDPEGAKYQIRMRKRAKKLLAEMKEEEEKQARLEKERIEKKKKEKEEEEKKLIEQKKKWREERGDPNVKNLEEKSGDA